MELKRLAKAMEASLSEVERLMTELRKLGEDNADAQLVRAEFLRHLEALSLDVPSYDGEMELLDADTEEIPWLGRHCEAAEIAGHEGDIGGVDGDVVAQRSHSNSEVAFGKGGGVVEAIADYHDTLTCSTEGADVIDLVLR